MKKITIVTLIFTFIFLSVYIFVLYFVDPLVLIENQTKDEVIIYTCKVDCRVILPLLVTFKSREL